MKKLLKIVWGIFAFIGILTTSGLVYAYFAKYYISIYQLPERHYISDLDGVPLSLKEIRDHYISGEDMVIYDLLKDIPMKDFDNSAYMAENTYWFRCPETLSYYQEDRENREREAGRYINLVPAGFESFVDGYGNVNTSNADIFWAAPI